MSKYHQQNSLLSLFAGNAGTWEQFSNYAGLSRSHIKLKSGNMGTQLYLLKKYACFFVPTSKMVGTGSHAEPLDLQGLYPCSRVPSVFRFRRVNIRGKYCSY
jgi:hypothetical protein